MLFNLYRTALRWPRFRGRDRLTSLLRRWLRPHNTKVRSFTMQLDPVEWVQVEILAAGGHEPQTTALYGRLLGPGDHYVDVGAHVGYLALVARECVGESGRVLAIEPQPYNCSKIMINAALSGFANIVTAASAVGDRDGFVLLRDQAATDKARLSLAADGVNDGVVAFETPIATLDTLVERHAMAPIKLLKIDVEGFELAVFSGAAKTLAQTENIVFEALPDMDRGDGQAIRALLASHGFTLNGVDGQPWTDAQAPPENNVWARRAGYSSLRTFAEHG
jgi:FkbM family methyltransferase